ncbi:hypothetical protein F2Q70_00019636 [Brassica cretica]|uniref:Uncharacterized protein n=1 Tax=Brassica cretica TaxID=69181 RepID=A0A8S9GLP9_BRACR|nr:hypothetical protein F2Q70_00019636 [Brassica cretica]
MSVPVSAMVFSENNVRVAEEQYRRGNPKGALEIERTKSSLPSKRSSKITAAEAIATRPIRTTETRLRISFAIDKNSDRTSLRSERFLIALQSLHLSYLSLSRNYDKRLEKTIPPPSALPQLSSTSTPLSRSFSTAAAVVCVDQSPHV